MAKMTKEIIKRDYKPFGGSFKSGQKLVTFEGKTYIKKDASATKKPVAKKSVTNKTVTKKPVVKKSTTSSADKFGASGKGIKPTKRKVISNPTSTAKGKVKYRNPDTAKAEKVSKIASASRKGETTGKTYKGTDSQGRKFTESTRGGRSTAVKNFRPKIKATEIGADFSSVPDDYNNRKYLKMMRSGDPFTGGTGRAKAVTEMEEQALLDEFNRVFGAKGGGMMNSKRMAKGGKIKTKGMAKGGKMKTKGYSKGGKTAVKKMASGKRPMSKDPKTGKMIPTYAMDGVGKMMKGGMMKSKGYAKGGMMKSKGYAKGGVMKKKTGMSVNKRPKGATVARGSGAARTQYFRKNG